ncbi:hypothetical protein QOZ80_5BG0440980 [Eleusine coracana subsp. coracana]|nr:hypothetical protein QOZ80_5BG0440980 [Eleusine coracana subsp. coracana]
MATGFLGWRAGGSGSGSYSEDDGSGSPQPTCGSGSGYGDDDGGVSFRATSGSSRTSGTTACTSPSEPFGFGGGQVDFTLPTASVVETNEEERAIKLEHIKGLVLEFFGCNGNNVDALERWLSELDVSWVLHLNHASESARIFFSRQLQYLARSWILALYEVSGYIDCWCSQEEATLTVGPPPSALLFVQFLEATLSKMLRFVDAIVAVRISGSNSKSSRPGAWVPAEEKLQAMVHVRDAVSTASERILSSFRSSTTSVDEGRNLLSAEETLAKLDEAIWDTIDKTRTGIRSSSSRNTPAPQRSPDIHMVTRSVSKFIDVLWTNYGLVNSILHDAYLRGKFFPKNEDTSHLTNLITEIVDSLEEKLTRNSQSFQDQSLKFLFLINNFHFVQQLQTIRLVGLPMPALSGKVDEYINSYIQVSWAPVLKCLDNPAPRCFTRHSPLQKFQSKFQKTYTAQKLWKVPDPEMRKTLRTAIVEELIPDYTEFVKDNTISTKRIAPHVMKNMLQELFEG